MSPFFRSSNSSGHTSKLVLAFDIYGTLLDTSKVTEDLSSTFGLDDRRAADISALWRRYQLEYTWRLNSEPFDIVTKKALVHALSEFGVSFTQGDVAELLNSYNSLKCFPDAAETLRDLQSLKEVDVVVFSNGTEAMVRSALRAASIDSLPSAVYVADTVQKYKPAPEIYQGLVEAVGKAGNAQDVFLVSGNPFDVTGALASGLRAIWVDRVRKGWIDQLRGQAPTVIVDGLGQIKQCVEKTLLR